MVLLTRKRPVVVAAFLPLNCSRLLYRVQISPILLKKLLTPVRTKRGVTVS